ncbi:MAG TPA: aminoacyl-tRNA hydrolase [Candidatus Paceibacterota bacterium]
MYFVFGLGNPGEEYKSSRHNTGRMAVDYFEKKPHLVLPLGRGGKATIIESLEFMNNSGKAVAKIIKSKKAAENLIVVYDDIDLPLGTIKIAFNKGSGGHRGLESVVKALKTKEFTRIRIGIAPTTPSGKIKKPAGEQKVLDFILGDFKPKEMEILKKVFKKSAEAIEMIIKEGKERAMNEFN